MFKKLFLLSSISLLVACESMYTPPPQLVLQDNDIKAFALNFNTFLKCNFDRVISFIQLVSDDQVLTPLQKGIAIRTWQLSLEYHNLSNQYSYAFKSNDSQYKQYLISKFNENGANPNYIYLNGQYHTNPEACRSMIDLYKGALKQATTGK